MSRVEMHIPHSMEELLALLGRMGERPYRYIAGGTDVLLELRRKPDADQVLINLYKVSGWGFREISHESRSWWIGAGVTIGQLAADTGIAANFPVLHQAALHLASPQIRNLATVGGNACTASPSGDVACALVALDAVAVAIDAQGKRRRMRHDAFYLGPRKTALRSDECLLGFELEAADPSLKIVRSQYAKVGTRMSMECSVVSLASHLLADEKGCLRSCGVAIGAVAPTIRRTDDACRMLEGKIMGGISEQDVLAFADAVAACASPISDLRASAWYRDRVLRNLATDMISTH